MSREIDRSIGLGIRHIDLFFDYLLSHFLITIKNDIILINYFSEIGYNIIGIVICDYTAVKIIDVLLSSN